MTDGTVAQHPPAMKVGGRRLSISMKHKAPISVEAAATTPETGDKKETTIPDYPRPAPPAASDEAAQQVHRNEEELPPKKKKYNYDNEKKVQEYAHWKTETTRPTRDMNGGNKGQTMGVRIGQPAGKTFGA